MARLGLALAAAATLVALGAAPAAAHPLGPPPNVVITAEGPVVTLQWRAAQDDGAAIAASLGLLPAESVDAYLGGDAGMLPDSDDRRRVSESPRLHAYLLDHVGVHTGATACEGAVESIEDFIDEGATLVFTCPEAVRAATITITALNEADDAYRTFGFAGAAEPELAVFTRDTPAHTYEFTSAPATAGGPPWAALAAVAAVVALAGGALATRPAIRRLARG